MSKKLSANDVFRVLEKLYNPPKSFLRYRSHLDLLIAVILSAQCTDNKVNEVTSVLFNKYRTAEDYVKVSSSVLEKDIHSTGFYKNKAKNIQAMCHLLLQKHGGKVPRTMEELVVLPGVGRKTAAIVLSVLFDKQEGVAVDTHVLRLSQRLGLTKHKEQGKVERDLMEALPRGKWGRLNPLMISHGRAVCTAKKPQCKDCVFRSSCPSAEIS